MLHKKVHRCQIYGKHGRASRNIKRSGKLTNDGKNYKTTLEQMSKKILELKNKIKEAENKYNSLKTRATVAKTTKKINQLLSSIGSNSTMAMIMKQKLLANSKTLSSDNIEDLKKDLEN